MLKLGLKFAILLAIYADTLGFSMINFSGLALSKRALSAAVILTEIQESSRALQLAMLASTVTLCMSI